MDADQFLKKLDDLTAGLGGRLLTGVQKASGGMSVVPYDGQRAHPNGTHINTARFHPNDGGGWSERGHLVTCTMGLVLDDVGQKVGKPSLTPTAVIETSPGNEQWLYVYAERLPVSTTRGMTTAAALADLSDQFIANRFHHWFRLPGSLPEPKRAQGRTERAKLTLWTGQVFTLADLKAGLDIEPKEREFRVYKGSDKFDTATAALDPVLKFLRAKDALGDGPDARGFYNVPCPRFEHHTDRNRPWGRYVPPNAMSAGGFLCFHSKCGHLGLEDFRAFIETNGGPTAKAALQWAGKLHRFRLQLAALPPEKRPALISAFAAAHDPDAMRARLAKLKL